MKKIKAILFSLLAFLCTTPLLAGIERKDAQSMFHKFKRNFRAIRHVSIYEKIAPRDIYALDQLMDKAKKFILKEEWKKAYFVSGQGTAFIRLLKAKKVLHLTKQEFQQVLKTLKK